MKIYTYSEARQNLASLLDEARQKEESASVAVMARASSCGRKQRPRHRSTLEAQNFASRAARSLPPFETAAEND
jgi:hypothetical protein